jgi:hypothetical protein
MRTHESDAGSLREPSKVGKLDVDVLKDAVSYDPLTGDFTWKLRPFNHFSTPRGARVFNTRFSGKTAGCLRRPIGNEYVTFRLQGVLVYAHRAAWAVTHGDWPVETIDHVNGNKSDNRISNLRAATHSENQRNAKQNIRIISGVKGVYWSKDRHRWYARLRYAGAYHHLGSFGTIEEAEQAVRAARELNHGEFANHG